ncbi:hypothetical protein GN157_08455 [Flavobacterium rakeshii]|uniref:Gliding motility-associated C-terminal domain-containing protein n=1 Tax=Flavobacterium rakeshii TaxID=1038845 RepID=A0A6N8HAR7_9FLAO|nr:hypothetical protein [Flavobacterium rakeshii]MUV03739.1 hypothetical protein [Flavobacterium rakeshii]
MNISLTVKRLLFMFSLLLFSMATFAKLPDFTLTVTPTAQTCFGNGALGFSVPGVNPLASIDYTIYLLPDTTAPVGIITSSAYNNLHAGDYMVVATQSLSGQSNTQIIISEMSAGIYTVAVTNPDGCSVMASVNIENTYCRIPRAISPGDSDFNNEFDLSNLGVQNLKIFNRYGLKVYDKGELSTDTYYYVVTLSVGKQVTGWVYLQRRTN